MSYEPNSYIHCTDHVAAYQHRSTVCKNENVSENQMCHSFHIVN